MSEISLLLFILSLIFLLKKNYSLDAINKKMQNQLDESLSFAPQLEQQKQDIYFLNCKVSELELLNKSGDSKISELKTASNAMEAQHKLELKEKVASARKDAIKKSRAVIRGQATEHLAPYILEDTNPKDYRFLGNPIDYIHFQGLSNLLDGVSDEIISIDFIDIKTGKASLNKSQRRIRDAIKNSRVKFSLINLDERLTNNDQITKESQTENQEDS